MTAPVTSAPDDLPTEVAAAPTPTVPDRADAPVSEVAERFLRAVIAEVPLDRVEELHLFSPLRQGTVETGIAVLAARIPVAIAEVELEAVPSEPELFDGAAVAGEADEPVVPVVGDIVADDAPADGTVLDEAPIDAAPTDEVVVDEVPADEVMLEEDLPLGDGEIVVESIEVDVIAAEGAHQPVEAIAVVADEESMVSVVGDAGDDDEDVSYDGELAMEASADEGDEAVAVESVPQAKPERLTVYTARYRYVIKGPERGKWEASVVAEADAPLITVETVVRGVQRRAGEDSEIVRYTAAQIARALRVPYPR